MESWLQHIQASFQRKHINHEVFSAVRTLLYTSYVQKAFLKPHYQKQSVLSALPLLTASATISSDEEVGPKGQRIAQPPLHKALLFCFAFLFCFFCFQPAPFQTTVVSSPPG